MFKLRRLNPSLFMLLIVEWTLGDPKSLGLNWNRQNLYIRNGMNCNNTRPRCSSRLNILSRLTCYFVNLSSLSIILSRGRTTKALIRLRGCVGWPGPLIFECNYVRFSLDTAHKYNNCHNNNCIVFQCFHTLARSVNGWHAQRALLIIASINWKSEVSTKKNKPKREKKGHGGKHTRPKSGAALAVLPDRRRRPCLFLLKVVWKVWSLKQCRP